MTAVVTTVDDGALARNFVCFALEAQVLRFGSFTTKAGRQSPYFFNAGAFDDGSKLAKLAEFYASRLLAPDTLKPDGSLPFDMIFGPAYKGITLAAAVAMELARRGRPMPFAFNRKEAKDHGEGGLLIGAPLTGRVLIIDDVMSAGTSVRESIDLIRASGATPAGVAIALDRQERASGNGADTPQSAVQFVREALKLPVWPIATLADLLAVVSSSGDAALKTFELPVRAYRERYGV
ncbi:MAG: orotate phosphoribosyltransferase [Pseudomonadota bacterium]|nr:orotate phosphoribosyltransferase [Pseudomonadota bacterium]